MSSANSPLVVCVDDDEIILDLLRVALASLPNLRVRTFTEAQVALNWIANEPAVCGVVTDYRMPEMDGAEFARAIRKQRPSLPIVCVTGFLSSGLEIDSFDDVIEKPFDVSQLLTTIRLCFRLNSQPLTANTQNRERLSV